MNRRRVAPRRSRPPLPLAVLSLALMHAHGASAQTAGNFDAPLTLKRTPLLTETLTPADRGQMPSIVTGDRISGRPDLETVVEGNATLRRGAVSITADRLEYYQPDDRAKATGNVRVNQAGNVYEGPELQLKLETFEGFFNNVRYQFLVNEAHGEAKRIDFVDANVSIAREATYTTCRREDFPGWMPAWLLTATTMTTDTEENEGVAKNARLSFMGITTPPIPSVSFPLSNERKSGLLPPTIGIDNTNGIEIAQPYYWNIAPNRDATITPTIMSKRGINFSNEFRYLEKGYNGTIRFDLMGSDRLMGQRYPDLGSTKRWGVWGTHHQDFDAKALGLDSLSANISINRVSDNDYWRDFTRTPSLAQRQLPNDASLNWSKGDWSGIVRTLKYQNLQYDLSPIVPAYDKMPQITANYNKYDWHGFDVSLNLDYTHFRVNTILPSQLGYDATQQSQPDGDRAMAVASISRPFITPSSFVIPKLMLNAASYNYYLPQSSIPTVTVNGTQYVNGQVYNPSSLYFFPTSSNRAVPTFSLDSGLTFERDANYFGRAFRQTLEPRAYYVYTPYRNQSMLPNYDSAANDFSFATIYTENAFSGGDRVSDTNALTLGVTSRLIDPATGVEAARFGIAQRLRFSDQKVTLPGGTPVTDRASDLLVGAQINWTPKWSLDTLVQYNPDTRKSERSAISARYNPEPYHNLSAAFRYQAPSTPTATDGSKSIDVGWQWPINDLWGDKGKNLGPGKGQGGGRWYAVGRLNYSLQDKKLTDGVLGFEYDGCCWIGRVVLQRITTGQVTANTRIMFQLEFVGFSSIGSSPMQALRQNIQRYEPLRQPGEAPSRFTNYD
ncbi:MULTISPECIES: LPS-assembly protein LptD [Variovorax]|jgi:LPS-assembly protein|uniref:LPS-assembly protein LptD n=1 Tax=Variovorax TaxID=34072 RepID=UPI00089B814F|nr:MULTISPECIES: LPS-assembly protein LptD [Variovorax]MDQ0081627.1 LPS-assembly protein [Variovorax boronicumulans]SDX68667.1 LPS-assembly protein [Variovorax sp. YR634]SET41596.1 LPS-assembly protein [Variovorax sp. OV084]SOD22125.1 LPS-assembly protein [Variovorax sp. YR752]